MLQEEGPHAGADGQCWKCVVNITAGGVASDTLSLEGGVGVACIQPLSLWTSRDGSFPPVAVSAGCVSACASGEIGGGLIPES